MIKIEINGTEFLLKSNLSVLEACKYVGIHVYRFCFHESLSVAGNCRVCLVEIANSPKPVASCAIPVLNNMKIFVDTPLVKKARENVIESLLLNHPLDCPICDQGGECDLQDQSKLVGSDYSRYFFKKRGVEDKYCGPLIKTIMTRCIHCTRCVRFGTEIAGVDYLGTLNRGTHTEISGYISNSFNSEISGNIIDLCPVGALTSKPYSFRARPWELRTTESVDLTDSTGSNIFIDFKESEIFRILPKVNKNINGSIITDKARFSYDSIKNERITHIFKKESEKFTKISSWYSILDSLQENFSNRNILFLINSELDLNGLNSLKNLTYRYSSITLKSIIKSNSDSNIFFNWFQNKLSELNVLSKVCLLISANIKIESAIINSKLRLKYSNEDFSVFGTGLKYNSNYAIPFINLSASNIINILESKNLSLSCLLLKFKAPLIIVGESLQKRGVPFINLHFFFKKILPTAILFNISSYCNTEGLSLSNISGVSKSDFIKADLIICVNLDDNVFLFKHFISKGKKVFWLNTNWSTIASRTDLILPLLSEFEEEKTVLNLEQRPQFCLKVLNGIGNTRSFVTLINFFIDKNIHNDFISYINEIKVSPLKFNKTIFFSVKFLTDTLCFNIRNVISLFPIKSSFEDFYRSNKYTKKSLIMSKCSQEIRKSATNF